MSLQTKVAFLKIKLLRTQKMNGWFRFATFTLVATSLWFYILAEYRLYHETDCAKSFIVHYTAIDNGHRQDLAQCGSDTQCAQNLLESLHSRQRMFRRELEANHCDFDKYLSAVQKSEYYTY